MIVTATMAETRRHYVVEPVGLVPTMGFLHEGHVALLEAARSDCALVVMSHFVNPLQFNQAADLERYPRDFERDAVIAEEAGVDVIFAPTVEEMYPRPTATRVTVDDLADRMEGEYRPGHFSGVATVVAKLLAGLQPHRAYFGRKDAQQLAIIKRVVADLSIPTVIVPHSTVRESDGLALSSRNVLLDTSHREDALSLSRGLMAAADAAEAGERSARALEEIVLDHIALATSATPQYSELATVADVARADTLAEDSFLAVAAVVGDIRLIDNVHLDVHPEGVTADRGIHLERPSVLYSPAEPAEKAE